MLPGDLVGTYERLAVGRTYMDLAAVLTPDNPDYLIEQDLPEPGWPLSDSLDASLAQSSA